MTPLAQAVDESLDGLLRKPPRVSSKILYNAKGIQLFEKVKHSPSYRIASVEPALIQNTALRLAELVPAGGTVVEYGGSAPDKVWPVLEALRPSDYVSVDLSDVTLQHVQKELDGKPFRVHTIAADFLQPMELPGDIERPALGICVGLTLCNFDPADVQECLRNMWHTLGAKAQLLVSLDIVGNGRRQQQAYGGADHALAEFVLNALVHLNYAGGTNFDVDAFGYRPVWNSTLGRLELSIVSKKSQSVRVRDRDVPFAKGKRIIVVSSYKYTIEEFTKLACNEATGWSRDHVWCDANSLCALILLRRND